jgi:hypothetical protein
LKPERPTKSLTGLNIDELHSYFLLVEEYTRKQLSFPSDVLNAFEGGLKLLKQRSKEFFVYGLHVSSLDLALLWIEAEPLERRIPQTADAKVEDIIPS